MTQSGHNFAYVTTAELQSHVQTCYLIELLELVLQQEDFTYELINYFPLIMA